MLIESITVRDLGVISSLSAEFGMHNAIIGYNGSGKTTLLRAIAGICGTDEATDLIRRLPVRFLEINLRHGNQKFSFTANDQFKLDAVRAFKNSLPHRVNFPCTSWGTVFPHGCVSFATGRYRFWRYCKLRMGSFRGDLHDFVYRPSHRYAECLSGMGTRHAMSLCLYDSVPEVPTILDNFDRHIDYVGKGIMMRMLATERRQLLYTTHSPEMFDTNHTVIDLSSCNKA